MSDYCTYGRCGNPAHDHLSYVRDDGLQLDIPVPLTCRHCHLPSHWDETISDYQHDDPAAPVIHLEDNDPAAAFLDELGRRVEAEERGARLTPEEQLVQARWLVENRGISADEAATIVGRPSLAEYFVPKPRGRHRA